MPLILPKVGTYELEEKRSIFKGYCAPVNNEPEAKAVIAQIRAENPKAGHNCFAYATIDDAITRASDDGEPSGTAGLPILTLFQKQEVVNFVCVVTRYWGGTLLGTGGLVRAYSHCAKGALDNAGPAPQITTKLYKVTCAYNRFDQVKYNFEKQGLPILNVEYTTHCDLTVEVTEFQEAVFLQGEIYDVQLLATSKHGVKGW